MQTYTEIKYKIRDVEGVVLIGETITDIDDIKSICRRDYLENLEQEIKLDEIEINPGNKVEIKINKIEEEESQICI